MASWPAVMPRSPATSTSPNPAMTLSIVSKKIDPEHCAGLAHPEYTNFVVSLVLLIGILLSYCPQYYRIISRRSSEGISPYFVLLGTLSASSALANIIALPTSRADWACCSVNSNFSCFAGLLGIGQLFIQWVCFSTIMLLFLVFFPRATAFVPPHELKDRPTYRTALIVTALGVLHAVVLAVLTVMIGALAPEYLQSYANVLGLCAAAVTSVQYLPQIWTTWRMGRVGSLSIPMMCVQTPGGFIWAASLAARLGWAGWSTWGIYVLTASMQGVLLVMGGIFEFNARRKNKDGDESEEDDGSDDETLTERPSETTPLMRQGSGKAA